MRFYKITDITDNYVEAVNIDNDEEGMVLTNASRQLFSKYEKFEVDSYIVISPDNVLSVMTNDEFEVIKNRRENNLN